MWLLEMGMFVSRFHIQLMYDAIYSIVDIQIIYVVKSVQKVYRTFTLLMGQHILSDRAY